MDLWEIVLYGILIYIVVINMTAFFAFGWDKRKAKKDVWRTPEKRLIQLALLGGSIGALVGMRMFHHKTRKAKFYMGIPAILFLQIASVCGLIIWIYK